MGMRRLDVIAICRNCQRSVPAPAACPECGGERFDLLVELQTEGFIGLDLNEWLILKDAYSSSREFELSGVTLDELVEILRGPFDASLRVILDGVHRGRVDRLAAGEKVCARCGIIFRVYRNPWHDAGACSRTCGRVLRRRAG